MRAGERHLVRAASAWPRCGPVQPFGVRSTSIGQRGRSEFPARASSWIRRIAATISSSAAAIAWCIGLGLVALDEPRLVAVAAHQRVELFVRDPAQDGRVGDLVAVEVQDRQHRSVPRRVQELVRVPARGERAGLGLAVADHAGDQQVGVVERGAVGVRERVAELAALVDRARRLRRDVARDAAGERELPEQLAASRPRRARCPDRPRCSVPSSHVLATSPGPPWPGPAM